MRVKERELEKGNQGGERKEGEGGGRRGKEVEGEGERRGRRRERKNPHNEGNKDTSKHTLTFD